MTMFQSLNLTLGTNMDVQLCFTVYQVGREFLKATGHIETGYRFPGLVLQRRRRVNVNEEKPMSVISRNTAG